MQTPSALIASLVARLPSDKPDLRVAIVGSRKYPRLLYVRLFVRGLLPGTVVVSGHGGDVDKTAEAEARVRTVLPDPCIFAAKWEDEDGDFDRNAGFKRNPDIVGDADVVVAFWDLASRGTADSILLANGAGKLVAVVDPRGEILSSDEAVILAEKALAGRKVR